MDSCKDEIDLIIRILFLHIGFKFLLHVKITLSSGHHHVFHPSLQFEAERAVVACHLLLVRAVITYDTDNGIRHRFLILVQHHSGDCNLDFRIFKTIYIVISTRISAIGREETGFPFSICYAEIIPRRIDRQPHILDAPSVACGIKTRLEKIETPETGMPVGREIEQGVGAEIGEHLIASRIDLRT